MIDIGNVRVKIVADDTEFKNTVQKDFQEAEKKSKLNSDEQTKTIQGNNILQGKSFDTLKGVISKVSDAYKSFTKDSIQLAGRREQAETSAMVMFGGKNSEAYKKIQSEAQKAYKSMGLSATEYYSSVSTFGAKLSQDLGQGSKASAEYANKIAKEIKDISKGADVEISSVQRAFEGFGRGNYTMLDNLRKGYGGTKSEMERMLKDAENINKQMHYVSKTHFDINNLADIADAIEVINKKDGTWNEANREATTTYEGLVESVHSQIDNLMTQVGETMLPIAEKALNKVTTLFNKFSEMDDKTKEKIIKTGLIMGGVAVAITGIGKAFSIVQTGITVFKELKDFVSIAQSGFTLLASPIGLVVAGIGALVGVCIYLFNTNKDFHDTVIVLWNDLKDNVSSILTQITGFINSHKEEIKIVIQDLTNFIQGVFSGIADFVKSNQETFKQLFTTLMEYYKVTFEMVKGLFELLAPIVLDILKQIMAQVKSLMDVVRQLMPILKPIFDFIASTVGQLIIQDLKYVIGVIKGIISAINTLIAVIRTIKGAIEDPVNFVKSLPAKARASADKISGAFKGVPDKIKHAFNNAGDIGKYIVDKILGGLKSSWNKLSSFVAKNNPLSAIKMPSIPNIFGGGKPKHRTGLYEVPYDGYQAILHKGERVLTREEAKRYNRNESTGNVNNTTFNITVPRNDNAYETANQIRQWKEREIYGF